MPLKQMMTSRQEGERERECKTHSLLHQNLSLLLCLYIIEIYISRTHSSVFQRTHAYIDNIQGSVLGQLLQLKPVIWKSLPGLTLACSGTLERLDTVGDNKDDMLGTTVSKFAAFMCVQTPARAIKEDMKYKTNTNNSE